MAKRHALASGLQDRWHAARCGVDGGKTMRATNSRSRAERERMYREEGYTLDGDIMWRDYADADGTRWRESRTIPADGDYDPWYPLPTDASGDDVDEAQAVNAGISSGDIMSMPGRLLSPHIPTAWIDHRGAERNRAIYDRAARDARSGLYRRVGSRFVRVGA